ncbi:hypothetical protein ST37_12725 [Vibrio sp. qd031]|uniref:hypothetical protein n=1 Tax=Vibrio sp. qd031 TaxID=1603038 RepID=UPI000A11FEF5|nr:hypothetical protein [Vibrio sp. qd031]ORT49290.1 hypothetical protein ST37_12725 [Vibrio sp. qd031]
MNWSENCCGVAVVKIATENGSTYKLFNAIVSEWLWVVLHPVTLPVVIIALIPIEVIDWSENCAGKTAKSKAKITVDSCSTYKIFNAAISDFNKQE